MSADYNMPPGVTVRQLEEAYGDAPECSCGCQSFVTPVECRCGFQFELDCGPDDMNALMSYTCPSCHGDDDHTVQEIQCARCGAEGPWEN